MADSIGEFSLKHIGNAYTKNDEGVVVAYANYEGLYRALICRIGLLGRLV